MTSATSMTDVWSPGRFVRRGLLALGLGLGGFAGWALLTEIDGAVIASATVEVAARRQMIQHPDGGIVAAIPVREGDRVATGDTILLLDGAELAAEHALVEAQLHERAARRARLLAEATGAETPDFPPALAAATDDPARSAVLAAERSLFDARRALHDRTLAQVEEQKVQARAEIDGLNRQRDAALAQRTLAARDLAAQETLLATGLTQAARVTSLSREIAELDGRIGATDASIAEARSRIAALDIELLRREVDRRGAAQEALAALTAEEAELQTRLRVIDTRRGRLRLVAPMAGRVLGLQVHTVGGVVPPGGEIAAIVPETGDLYLAARIPPTEVDRVAPGASVRLRFSSFNANLTPETEGRLRTLGADALTDPQSGLRYYPAEIGVTPEALARLGEVTVIPGMPVEAFILTKPRSPASWLLKPVADAFAFAMREE